MKILLCVSASVSLYKACELIRSLINVGHTVRLIPSPSSCKMISPILMEALGVEVFTKDTGEMEHIKLSRWCDILLLCPATASTIGKIANGIGGNLLLDTFLARKQSLRTIIVPAMNVEMWNNLFVKKNIANLKKSGFELIEPTSGTLACGEEGNGKLASIDTIIKFLFPQKKMRVLITAGGTIEKIDDVRYLSNISSGKQAFEIVQAFTGHDVTIIKANTDIVFPSWCKVINVESAKEMLCSVENTISQSCDIFISAAAVADFTFNKINGKIKKNNINTLELIPNIDILQTVAISQNRPKCVVGFAAESENLIQNAKEKMQKKKCDFMIGNELVFGSSYTKGILLGKRLEEKFECSKVDLAKKLASAIKDFLNETML